MPLGPAEEDRGVGFAGIDHAAQKRQGSELVGGVRLAAHELALDRQTPVAVIAGKRGRAQRARLVDQLAYLRRAGRAPRHINVRASGHDERVAEMRDVIEADLVLAHAMRRGIDPQAGRLDRKTIAGERRRIGDFVRGVGRHDGEAVLIAGAQFARVDIDDDWIDDAQRILFEDQRCVGLGRCAVVRLDNDCAACRRRRLAG